MREHEQNHQSLAALLALSEEELLISLARELDKSFHVFPRSPSALIEMARLWLKEKRMEIQCAICTSEKVREHALDSDQLILAVAITDLIAGICIGVSPATVAVLLVKMQVKKYCKSYWQD